MGYDVFISEGVFLNYFHSKICTVSKAKISKERIMTEALYAFFSTDNISVDMK